MSWDEFVFWFIFSAAKLAWGRSDLTTEQQGALRGWESDACGPNGGYALVNVNGQRLLMRMTITTRPA